MNPLQRMLGTYLRVERARLGYSSAYVAGRLGLTDTYFRLAEAGRATLNQSLVFKIIEVFAASSAPTHDSRTISFNRLALFMVGMHWVSAEMALHKPREAGRRATEALALLVSDFYVFTDHVKDYFTFDEGSSEQKAFLENVAAPEVGEFLRSEAYGRPADVGEDIFRMRDLLDLPTLNIDILLDMKQALTGRSFVHTADVASKWESQRSSQFRYERGLYASSDLIVHKNNLDLFHFEHLAEERFLEVQMIFMNAREDQDALKTRFVELLNAGRATVPGLKDLTTKEIDKIRFFCLTANQQAQHKDVLDQLRSRDATVHEAYWSFEVHSGLHIAFVGVSGNNADNTRNLNLRDSLNKAALFQQLWDAIDVARKN